MRPLKLPVGTVEFIQSRISVDRDDTNPTSFVVEFALVARDEMPDIGDWRTGDWADPDATEPPYMARFVPDTSTEGVFRLWVRVTTGDTEAEIVLRPCGLVEFVDYTGDAH